MIEKILVVDDEPDLELLIKQRFRKQIRENEFEFFFAENGLRALERLTEHPDINLVLSDINMPEMDGLTLLDRIGQLNRIIKAVIVSAYGDIEKIRIAMNRGAFDFITKPIDFDDLERTVGKTINEIVFVRGAYEAQQSLQEEKEKKEIAEHREKIKQQFLANMSHEIRTPINAIYGMSLLMLNKQRSEEDLVFLDAIKKSSQNLIVIVNDVLDLSKIEAGKMDFEKIPFKISESLELVKNTMRFKAEEKGLTINTSMDENVPETLSGDPTRLNQILINLTGNAIKFTEKGSIQISVSSGQLPEGSEPLAESYINLNFAVTDTGIGMTEEQLGRLFQSFVQASSDTARKYGGTGLGLTISKQFIELQGGHISVESKYGEGTTFKFNIPYELSKEKLEEKKEIKPTQEEIDKVNSIRILLADDNEFNQMVAEGLIKAIAENTTIDIVENGKLVIEKLNEAQNGSAYNIILMDVRMPEMNGLEATQYIRSNEALKNIPIIAMTAGATKEEIKECFDAGMNDYVPKPFDPNELIIKIAQLT